MKRHPELLELSREHYGALKLARDARRAAESEQASEVTLLAQRVVRFFATDLVPHFHTEEHGILLLLAQAGQHDLVERTLTEHEELRLLANKLASPDVEILSRFANLLAAHVRFEEREVFEVAQEEMAKR